MQTQVHTYIPKAAIKQVEKLLAYDHVSVRIKQERKTRHGDYKRMPDGKHQITINANLNPYRFLITLVHEVAHLEAFQKYGRHIKPHGKEWKHTFQRLMLPLLNPQVFPVSLLPLLAKHFKNPKASSDTDTQLAFALKQYDQPNNKTFVFQVPSGHTFKMYNGRVFKKGEKRVKRYECVEVTSGKLYLFNPNAEVELVN